MFKYWFESVPLPVLVDEMVKPTLYDNDKVLHSSPLIYGEREALKTRKDEVLGS